MAVAHAASVAQVRSAAMHCGTTTAYNSPHHTSTRDGHVDKKAAESFNQAMVLSSVSPVRVLLLPHHV